MIRKYVIPSQTVVDLSGENHLMEPSLPIGGGSGPGDLEEGWGDTKKEVDFGTPHSGSSIWDNEW